jgi:hypothetical protein
MTIGGLVGRFYLEMCLLSIMFSSHPDRNDFSFWALFGDTNRLLNDKTTCRFQSWLSVEQKGRILGLYSPLPLAFRY